LYVSSPSWYDGLQHWLPLYAMYVLPPWYSAAGPSATGKSPCVSQDWVGFVRRVAGPREEGEVMGAMQRDCSVSRMQE
jgi:hypothetical protein